MYLIGTARASQIQRYGAVSPNFPQNFKMILRHILLNKNSSNIAHTLLSTIKSYGVNPPDFFIFLTRLMCLVNRLTLQHNTKRHNNSPAPLELRIYRVKFSKIFKKFQNLIFFIYSGPLGKICSSTPEH